MDASTGPFVCTATESCRKASPCCGTITLCGWGASAPTEETNGRRAPAGSRHEAAHKFDATRRRDPDPACHPAIHAVGGPARFGSYGQA